MPAKGLTLLDFGVTPPYLTSSWEVLAEHFASPRRQRVLPTPARAGVVDFCLIPRTSPHHAGAHDPVAILALLASGELTLLGWPDGAPLPASDLLPLSLNLAAPPLRFVDVAQVQRKRWLGMVESRPCLPQFLEGGSPIVKTGRR